MEVDIQVTLALIESLRDALRDDGRWNASTMDVIDMLLDAIHMLIREEA